MPRMRKRAVEPAGKPEPAAGNVWCSVTENALFWKSRPLMVSDLRSVLSVACSVLAFSQPGSDQLHRLAPERSAAITKPLEPEEARNSAKKPLLSESEAKLTPRSPKFRPEMWP